MTKEQAKEKITELVSIFEEQRESYHRPAYDEAKTRGDFINKFFKALGWDVDNDEGAAEAYREVIPEDKLKIGGSMKAPDYAFTLSGNRKFFVEAKKPAVIIKTDKLPAYQLRRYGWNAKMPVSVLTNFEELSIYDCTKRPNVNDSAGIARIKYLSFRDYVKEFDFIWDTFSKEGVVKGRFDKFVQTDTQKRGTATVDKAFLESLDEWRKYLATSIARNNHALSDDELNFVVQQTLDRIIFLRFCEDRSVEPYGSLKDTLKQGDYYKKLFKLFKDADRKYNSGLFDFKKDGLSEKTVVDDKVIKNIITDLYYPNCDYDFSVLPVEILGNAYEQFLGKVIRVTAGHIVKIEEKPEVRKAGGVYYTPQYIVKYIVENTLGKLTEGKTPAEIEKIKIVDPACGSGSFLLGAFQYLLHYHTKYYLNNQGQKGLKGHKTLTPDGRLTTAEKRRILTNNIFGVDIDTQAVEVTKLSLLMKAMEGETPASITHQLTIGHERVLPNLDNNIKCGNSLIAPDFYDSQLNLEPDAERKINVFDWKKGFPKVFEQGGFDVVIGNPPYIPIEFFSDAEKNYYKTHFSELSRKYETSVLFILKGFQLLAGKGLVGFISTQTWQTGENYNEFRKKIFNEFGIAEIINLPFNIFSEAYVDTGIFIFSKTKNQFYSFYSFDKKAILVKVDGFNFEKINVKDIKEPDYKLILNNTVTKILPRLSSDKFISLGEITISTQGLSASVFSQVKSKIGKWVLPFIDASLKRYLFMNENQYWVNLDNKQSLFKFYLKQEKILIKRIINRQNKLVATYFNDEGVFKKDLNPFIITNENFDTKYLLGLINSSLFSWLYINTSSIATKDDFRQTTLAELRKLPIRRINSKDEVLSQNEIIKHVDSLLKLNEEKQNEKLPNKIEQLETRIAHSEERIDELVYELYGLSEEEIKIVKGV